MVYKGVYGSDKGEPIWLIWLFGDLWQEGAAFQATVQVDAWDWPPLLGRSSARDRDTTYSFIHTWSRHLSTVNIFQMCWQQLWEEKETPLFVFYGCKICANYDLQRDIFGDVTRSVINEIFETRACVLSKRSSRPIAPLFLHQPLNIHFGHQLLSHILQSSIFYMSSQKY